MSLLTRTDVTAVKLHKSFIIAGIGSNLEVYKKDSGKFIRKITALRGQKIYGIVPSQYHPKLLIFGGKQFTIFSILELSAEGEEALVIERDVEAIVCDDWLLSGVWLSVNKTAFLTAHNVVQIWNTENKSLENYSTCPDNSILYSGLLVPVQNDLLVLSGTVFSEVIVQWSGDDKPLHYLKGHKGVIFSITCDLEKQIIVTTSDDRSLRIWRVQSTENYNYTCKSYWCNAEIVCIHELYGHSARVMRNLITTHNVISIGEDAGICFWDLNGKLLRKVISHQNACIWALDANDDYLLTGGGDNGVIIHPLSLLTEYSTSDVVDIDLGTIKKVEFTAKGNIVILNESNLIYHDLKSKTNVVHKLNHKSTYKMLSLSSCKQIIAIVDMTGILAVFIENCKDNIEIKNIINKELGLGNILSMQWAGNRHLVVCSDNGDITVLASKGNDTEVFDRYVLPTCKERWLTSSTLTENKEMLVVSDRNGRIHVYARGNKSPVKTFDKVHGRYGATTINIRNDQIITTGRDGTIKYFSINRLTNDVKYMRSKDFEFQWVEKFVNKNENYICGFQERVFVVYDIKNNNKVFEVNCGGGHRSWDVIRYFKKINENFEEFIRLVYLKNSVIHLETFQISKILSRNIINGSHSKEINCLKTCIFNDSKDTIYYISGGEDTTLRISKSNQDTKFEDKVIFKKLSSVRTLKILPLGDNKILLVSGGGRAQVCVKIIYFNDKITSEELVDYMMKGTDKERKGNRNWKDCSIDFDPETRIMDVNILPVDANYLLVVTGCSDGILRIFTLEYNSKTEFKMTKEIRHHKTCILKTHIFKFINKDILAVATTRGNITFWDIEKTGNIEFDEVFHINTNKSGINSIDTKVIDDNTFLIATGGDDNAIHLNLIAIANHDIKSMKIIHNWTSDTSHCSQITGLKLISDFMVTTSIDQRITLFQVTIKNNIECEFISQIFSDVADIQGIDILKFSGNSVKVCVFGKGLEVIDIPCNKQFKS